MAARPYVLALDPAMSQRPRHLDDLLADWPFSPGQVSVRQVNGHDGRELLQMRVDMGLLQMEVAGRPDGFRPGGAETYFDYLRALAGQEGAAFELDDERCTEVDREFYQYYHRRICWLTLKQYAKAVEDADHTLALMDFTSEHAPDPEWSLLHEQYRPFVMFHKTQAQALLDLENSNPEGALGKVDQGLRELAEVFEKHDASEHFDEDGFVVKLREMREAIVDHYDIGPSLAEQLAAAVASEQYELAAELRDRMSRRGGEDEKRGRESI